MEIETYVEMDVDLPTAANYFYRDPDQGAFADATGPALDIATEFDVRIQMRRTEDSTQLRLGNQAADETAGYRLEIDGRAITSATLNFVRSDSSDFGSFTEFETTEVIPDTVEQLIWVRCTFISDNGSSQSEVNFYWSDDDQETWQLLDTITAASSAMFTDANPNFISANIGFLIYRVEYRETIGGALAAVCDFSDWGSGLTFVSSDTGETWTITDNGDWLIETDYIGDPETNTFRFSEPGDEVKFDSIPVLKSVSETPQKINPGKDMGVRASVSVSLDDFQYPLAGSQFTSGTFWPKLRALKTSLQGVPLRVIRGEAGTDIADMDIWHYVIESSSKGRQMRITAKDTLKLADGDRAQAPAVSTGRLLAAINSSETPATLTPTGIGDLEYPASGLMNIGNDEIVAFTRSGDDLTLTRGQEGTEGVEHDADAVCQLCLEYDSESPADIIYDLLTNYTEIDSSILPLAEWQADIDTYIGRLYSAVIAEPTDVKKLINELIEQVGLVMWTDLKAKKVRLKSLRPLTEADTYDTNTILEDSFSYREQPNERVSQVWTYFALKNPLEPLNEWQSYRSLVVSLGPASVTDQYPQPAIKKIYSRWILVNNRPAASRLNYQILSRFVIPPREFKFSLSRAINHPIANGLGVNLGHWDLQTFSGVEATAPAQVTSLSLTESEFRAEAQEMLFTNVDVEGGDAPDGKRLIVYSQSENNVNIRERYDRDYVTPDDDTEVVVLVEDGAVIGSDDTSSYAFELGSWPSGATIELRVASGGIIAGMGGRGGDATTETVGPGVIAVIASPGEDGGGAINATRALSIDNQGIIGSGGGGGGGAGTTTTAIDATTTGGGGGQGQNGGGAGVAQLSGQAGDIDGPGDGGNSGGSPSGGDGGALGADGEDGTGETTAVGGSAGNAINGIANVTYINEGDVRGPQV